MKTFSLASAKRAIAGPPFLPRTLVWVEILWAITQISVLLSSQPAAFWSDPQHAPLNRPLAVILHWGALPFIAIMLSYLVVSGLALAYLRQPFAFGLFGTLFIFHTEWCFRPALCGWRPFLVITNSDSCTAFLYLTSVIWLALLSLPILSVFLWKNSISEPVKRRAARIFTGLGMAWMLFLIAGLVTVAIPPATGWKPVTSLHSPGPRSQAAIAYDTKRQRAVLFGGISDDPMGEAVYHSDTWEWDGKDWIQVQAAGGPSGRMLHTMAYDEARGVVVLYGGLYRGNPIMDVWEWDGRTWTKRCPACCPAARYYHQMFYDPVRGQVVVYGGQNNDIAYHEGWAWDGQAWNGLQFDGQPPDFSGDVLAYDPGRQDVLAFLYGDWGGTWIWKGSSWTKAAMRLQPPKRQFATLMYDPGLKQAVLFGGQTGNTWLNDTWVYKDQQWHQLKSAWTPPARATAMSFYDMVRHKVMLYGGQDSNAIIGDMWELDVP